MCPVFKICLVNFNVYFPPFFFVCSGQRAECDGATTGNRLHAQCVTAQFSPQPKRLCQCVALGEWGYALSITITMRTAVLLGRNVIRVTAEQAWVKWDFQILVNNLI